MKTSIVILYVLVTLSLVFSLTAMVLFVQDKFPPSSPSITASPYIYTSEPPSTYYPTPYSPIYTPTPSPAPSTLLTLNYTESSKQEVSDETTRVVLTVTLTYNEGKDVTIDYSQFYLQLGHWRGIGYFYDGSANPLNSGTFTMGRFQPTEVFQLTFEYQTEVFNFMDMVETNYNLFYNGPATIQGTDSNQLPRT